VPPGSYSHDDNQKRGNIAVNKSGKGVVGTKTDYVQAWKKEHALANGQVLDRKGKIGISENKARCGLPRIIQRKENAPGAVRGSICVFALHLSVPFSHFFALDHPQRQLIGGRKGACLGELRTSATPRPGRNSRCYRRQYRIRESPDLHIGLSDSNRRVRSLARERSRSGYK